MDSTSSAPLVLLVVGVAISALIMVAVRARDDGKDRARRDAPASQILGFQEFMNRVDADRLKRMPPDTFEKFLPYAMASAWSTLGAGLRRHHQGSADSGTRRPDA